MVIPLEDEGIQVIKTGMSTAGECSLLDWVRGTIVRFFDRTFGPTAFFTAILYFIPTVFPFLSPFKASITLNTCF